MSLNCVSVNQGQDQPIAAWRMDVQPLRGLALISALPEGTDQADAKAKLMAQPLRRI